MYSAPNISPKSNFRGMSGVDGGLKKDLFKSKASLALNLSDIFNTRKFIFHNEGLYYSTDMTRKHQSRIATLNFTYKFGKGDVNTMKKKTNHILNMAQKHEILIIIKKIKKNNLL